MLYASDTDTIAATSAMGTNGVLLIGNAIWIHISTVSSVTVKPDFKNKHDLDIYDLR